MKTIPFNAENLSRMRSALFCNQAVILPTDTIYGIHLPLFKPGSTVITDNEQVINALKFAPLDKPVISLYTELDQIKEFVTTTELEQLSRLAHLEHLTIIVSGETSQGLAFRKISIGHLVLHSLITDTGPLLSSSANIHTNKYTSNVSVIKKTFYGSSIELFCTSTTNKNDLTPSTVIDIRQNPFQMIRKGRVSPETIEDYLE